MTPARFRTVVYPDCSEHRSSIVTMDDANRDRPVWLLPRWSQQGWMADRACSGETHLFFPPPAERPRSRFKREASARAVCQSCPVLLECRTYARIHHEHGFWGGETEEQRVQAGFVPAHPVGASRLSAAV